MSLVASFVLLAIAAASLGYGVLGDPSSTNTRLLLIGGRLADPDPGDGGLGQPARRRRSCVITGSPLRRFGGLPGTLASENARRNPGRTATTSAALMIGIAVVAFFAIFAHADHGRQQRRADRSTSARPTSSQPSADGAKIDGAVAGADRARCRASRPSRRSPARSPRSTGSRRHAAFGVDPKTFLSGYRFAWKHGSDALVPALGAHDALMTDTIATDEHLRVGQTVLDPDARRREGRVPARGHVRRRALPAAAT